MPKLGAAVMIILAGTLALSGTPTYQRPVENIEDWGKIVASRQDKVSPVVLGEWLIEERPGLRVIDLRDPAYFARFNIKGSENIAMPELLTKQGIAKLSPKGAHVLVSRDGVDAAQAWVILRGLGYEAYILDGGVEGWVSEILEGRETQDEDLAAKVYALKEKFLGDGAAIGSAPPPPPPTIAAPAAPTARKKKAGGC